MTAALVPAEHVHDLISDREQLERQLRAANLRNERLERSLTLAMTPYSGHTATTVDGVLTIVLNAGDVYQRATRVIDRPGESGYELAWVKQAPVPGSPASVLEDALSDRDGLTEMDVIDDQPNGTDWFALARSLTAS